MAAIARDAQTEIAALQHGIGQSATHLKGVIQAFQTQAQGVAPPDPNYLAAVRARFWWLLLSLSLYLSW